MLNQPGCSFCRLPPTAFADLQAAADHILRAAERANSVHRPLSLDLSVDEFCAKIEASGLMDSASLSRFLGNGGSATQLAQRLEGAGALTQWQCEKVARGQVKGFFVGQYVFLHPVGYGEAANVYAARHRVLRRSVALCVLRPDYMLRIGLDTWRSRIQAASDVSHPSLLRVIDAREAREIQYHVHDFVTGRPICEIAALKVVLPPRAIIALAIQFSDALSVLQSGGNVLPFLRSSDVLIDSNGRIRLICTGLSRSSAAGEGTVDVVDFLSALLPLQVGSGEDAGGDRAQGMHGLSPSDARVSEDLARWLVRIDRAKTLPPTHVAKELLHILEANEPRGGS